MAVATTTFTPPPMRQAFSGLDSVGGERSPWPNAEQRFCVLAGAVDVEAGGDSQKVDIQCDLPVNFAYTLMEIHMSIFGADIADWETNGDCFFTDGTGSLPQGRTMISAIPAWSEGVVGTLLAFRFDFQGMGVQLPANAVSTPQLRFIMANDTIDGSAMTVNFCARFLQFNIEQAHHFEVNSAMAVR